MKTILGLLTALLLTSPVMAETVLYCQDIAAGGVVFKDGRWTHTNFNLERYTFRLSDDRRTLNTKRGNYSCDVLQGLWITCKVDSFILDPWMILLSEDLSRFQWSLNRPGAHVATHKGARQSSISIGNCEKF